MAVKKRNTLRSKSVKKTNEGPLSNKVGNRPAKIAGKVVDLANRKKNKKILKQNSIVHGEKELIEKKEEEKKEQLAENLTEDLLSALTESTNTTIIQKDDGTEEVNIEKKVRLDHRPNPFKKSGQIALLKLGNESFKNVLKHKELRNGGLEALRNSILKNIAQEDQ